VIVEFVKWHDSIKEQIKQVTAMTKEPLSDEPEALIADLLEIEAWNVRVNFLLADANGWLDRGTLWARPSKGEPGVTEADRHAITDSLVAPVRVVRDKLESLADCIKQRLILGESLLAYHRQFHDRDIRGKSAGN
jgi:hypothetical protein